MIVLINTVCPQAEGGCGRELVLPASGEKDKQTLSAHCKCGRRWTVEIEHLKTLHNVLTGKVQSIDQLTFIADIMSCQSRE